MIPHLPWAEEIDAHGVERVARAVGAFAAGRLTCVYCKGWAAIREDDRVWNCSECATAGNAFTLATQAFWTQTGVESPTESDWAQFVRMMTSLGLCRG